MKDKARVGFISLAAAVSWLALGIQFYINIHWAIHRGVGTMLVIWNFLSYFTNLSNLLAGLTFLYALISPSGSKALNQKTKHISAVAVFISMTGIIFSLELRNLGQSNNLSNIANILLHDVTPVIFLMFWWISPHTQLRVKHVLSWLTFPVLYFVYLLIRGYFLDHYPYPFVNVKRYGYESVIENGLWMLAGFLNMGLLLVVLEKFKLKLASNGV